MKFAKIKIGYLVSYDYEYLMTSIMQIYDHVDEIYLAIDEDFKTWSGNSFYIPDNFFKQIQLFDRRKIIRIYRDKFYIPDLSPLECDTRERNMLLKRMGRGWLFQLDVDEYVYDFEKVVRYLKRYWYLTIFPTLTPISFSGKFITLFKEVPNGYLIINNHERFHFITNQRTYTYIRSNDKIKNHYSNIAVIHQSWARKDDEIKTKITNWSHRNDFDVFNYLKFWQELSEENYKLYKNFHPISPKVWEELIYFPAESIENFLKQYASKNPQELIELDAWEMIGAFFRKIRKTIFYN